LPFVNRASARRYFVGVVFYGFPIKIYPFLPQQMYSYQREKIFIME
jgi:hypothetical protein